MNVLVLQSFLAVLTKLQIVSSNCLLYFNISTVFVTPTMCVSSHPIYELFADWNMAEAVTVIPWDMREAYYHHLQT